MKRKRRNDAPVVVGYDYSDREHRETTVQDLFLRAKSARTVRESEWQRYNDYYNGIHDVTAETLAYCRENDLPWVPANVPDAWILVESQVDPSVPEPEFHGRDTDMDSKKAKQREFAVRYISENNRLSDMNTRNERRLLKLGDAFWKAYWDPEMRCGINEGDIRIKDIPVDAIFPDPSIRDGTIQDGQYLDYVYRIHKVKFCQMFRRELDELGITQEDILSQDYMERTGIFDLTTAVDDQDDTVQVLEHWFRQPVESKDKNGNTVPAGAVGCSIQAGGRELRYIPNYWEKTCRQNHLFPFVHYWRIQDENQIWNKSELFPVMDMIDAADRKLSMGILNDAFMANDILLVEDGALADGTEITNEPGAVVKLKQNAMGRVQRLGGLQSIANAAVGVDWFKGQIERATRNYDTSMGKEAQRITTATGMAMLRADAQSQEDIKKADRNAGFERLYELLDWLALEFYDDGRMLFIGADPSHDRPAEAMTFNSNDLSQVMPAVRDLSGEIVRESWTYWPKVDVTITASDSVTKSKAQTLQVLQALTQAQVTPENWRLFAAQLDLLDIPGKQEIIDQWQQQFNNPMMGATGGMPTQGGAPAMPGAPEQIPGAQTLPLMGGEPIT